MRPRTNFMGVQKGATYIGNISYSKTKAFLPTLRIPSRNSIQPHPTMASDFYMNKSPATLLLIIISTPRCTIFSKTFRNTVISLPETLPMRPTNQENTEHPADSIWHLDRFEFEPSLDIFENGTTG